MEKEKAEEKSMLKRKRKKSKEQEQNSSTTSKETNKRGIIRNTKRPNRKRLLKNKLEFFLSDINLYHDKYLKKIYLSNNESVSPEIFLSFNSIKILLCDIDKIENKKNVIIKAIEISNKLIYDKNTNRIKRVIPYKEKLINIDLYDKCTIYIENLPSIINHDIIYDLFKDYKILYISLIKEKNNKLNCKAFITLKNIEDVPIIINKYNNTVPKVISLLNPKQLKPLKLMTKEDYLKNKPSFNINNIKKQNKINNNNNKNIDVNTCIRIKNIKDNINLNNIKRCLADIVLPLFIDINRNENSIFLRFESKKESDLFLEKIKEKNYENIKEIVDINNEKDNKIIVEELNEEERKKYIDFVKKEIESFKEKKINKKLEKIKKINARNQSIKLDNSNKKLENNLIKNEKIDSDSNHIINDLNKKNNDKMNIENNEKENNINSFNNITNEN